MNPTDSGEFNPVSAITQEIDSAEKSGLIGMLRIKSANQAVSDAFHRPDPRNLYHSLWYEGEVCCLFADSNLGKSIYAVQMADEIAKTQKVLYVDCELSDKQFQLRYSNPQTGARHIFPENFLRAEIVADAINAENYEENFFLNIEQAAQSVGAKVIIIDNLTYLCNASEKGDVAGMFMMKLMSLKRKHGWSLLVIAHTPKRNLTNPITQNDLAGSKKLYNFFDSVFAIGKSAKDNSMRYVKQIKVRAGEYRYDSDNVMVYEIVQEDGFLHFSFIGFANEKEHLRSIVDDDGNTNLRNVMDLREHGKTVREIASVLGLSRSSVSRLMRKAEEDPVSCIERNQANSEAKPLIRQPSKMKNKEEDPNLFKKEE
jgi:RecA-family ATPase